MKNLFTFLVLLGLMMPVSAQTPLTVAEDFTVTDLDGISFNLFTTLNSGKYVVLDFYYCSCVPCQLNTPKVQFAYQYFGCNTSNVVFYSIDTGDNDAACRLFEENYQSLPGNRFPSVSGVEGGGTAVCSAYGINAYPTVILIAPDQNILERDIWPIANGEYLAGVIEGHGGIPASCSPVGLYESQNPVVMGFLNAFPNPVNRIFNLQFNVVDNTEISFEVYNQLGEKVLEKSSVNYSIGSNSVQLPVETLANGTYQVFLLSDKIKKDMCKMVIVK
jgi:hypothetical protein